MSKQRRGSLFSRNRTTDQIDGYHIGTVQRSHDVHIAPGASVAGDVIGDQVRVQGSIYGFVVANHVILDPQSEVWGDVYAQSIDLKAGSVLSGWVYTLQESVLSDYLATGRLPQPARQAPALPEALKGSVDTLSAELAESRAALLKRIADEAATARLARHELEQTFDVRVRDLVGDQTAEAARLKDDVEILRRERTSTQQKIGELTASIQSKEEELDALQKAREALNDQVKSGQDELSALEVERQHLTMVVSELREERERLSTDLDTQKTENEELSGRIDSLEQALDKSKQRVSEQEEALLHWQELVESQETRSTELKERARDFELTMTENQKLVNHMREEKETLLDRISQLEDEVVATQERVEESVRTQVEEETELLKEELDRKTKDLDLSKKALVESTALTTQLAQQSHLFDEQAKRVIELEAEVDTLKRSMTDLAESRPEISPAELEQLQTELGAAQQRLLDRETDLEQLQEMVQDRESEIARITAESADTETKLNEAIQAFKLVQSKLNKAQKGISQRDTLQSELEERTTRLSRSEIEMEQLQQEKQSLLAELNRRSEEASRMNDEVTDLQKAVFDAKKRSKIIQDAYDKDMDRLHHELEKQGQRLSEAQVALATQTSQLNSGPDSDLLKKKEVEIAAIKQKAAQAIRQYKQKLEEKEKQLQDMARFIEKRRTSTLKA